MFSHMYALVFGCLQPSFPLPEWIRCLGTSRYEGSIPFTRFRPLVPRGLQRGRPHLVGCPNQRNLPKGRKRRAEGPRQRPGGGPT